MRLYKTGTECLRLLYICICVKNAYYATIKVIKSLSMQNQGVNSAWYAKSRNRLVCKIEESRSLQNQGIA